MSLIKLSSLILLTMLLSFCSFGYQILIAFGVSATLGGSTVPWLLTIGAFLIGLGYGGFKAHALGDEQLRARFVPYEILVALVGGASLWILLFADSALNMTSLQTIGGQVPLSHQIIVCAVGCLLSGGVGYLSGFELPVVLKAFDRQIMQRYSHWVIGFHYAGTLFSSILVQGTLLPTADLLKSSLILGFLSCAIAFVSSLFVAHQRDWKHLASIAFVAGLFLFASSHAEQAYQYYLKIHYLRPTITSLESHHFITAREILDRSPNVERTRTKYQYIDLVRTPSPRNDQEMDTVLYLDTHVQFGSSKEKIYHELMTHVPIETFGVIPSRVLIAGGGDGLLARELLRYPEINKIDLVELDADLLDMAMMDDRFTRLNLRALENPKVEVMVDDAFQYLRRNDIPKYDAIYIDFPFPHNPDLARLYSREFYRLAKRNLAQGGFIVLDFPMELLQAKTGGRNDVIFNTLKSAGFTQFFPFTGYDSFIAARTTAVEIKSSKSPLISEQSQQALKLRTDVLEQVAWDDRYVHSIFHPLSFGQGFE